jgi:hypothetical protein
MDKAYEKVKKEFLALLPPTIFFFFTLGFIAVLRALMLSGTGISVTTPIQVAVGALILGKAVLIADMLPVVNRFPDRPLAYNVVWKTAIYFVAALVLHYVERLVEFWRASGGLVAGNERLLAEMVWPHFWAIQLTLLVLIFGYCVMREIARALGTARLREMFFGPPSKASMRAR